jgi:hypothetical protein
VTGAWKRPTRASVRAVAIGSGAALLALVVAAFLPSRAATPEAVEPTRELQTDAV